MNFILRYLAVAGQAIVLVLIVVLSAIGQYDSEISAENLVVTGTLYNLIAALQLNILVSKEFFIFHDETLVVISFVSFIYFLSTKISDLIYVEIASRSAKIYQEMDINLFYHQQIINSILELYKVASYIQNKLKNEYIFFRHVFLLNLWPCKAINYINNNISNIERNFNIIYNDKQNLDQEIQLNKQVFDYELIKNLSKVYMYN